SAANRTRFQSAAQPSANSWRSTSRPSRCTATSTRAAASSRSGARSASTLAPTTAPDASMVPSSNSTRTASATSTSSTDEHSNPTGGGGAVSAETPAAAAPPVKLFTRQATGLVRDVGPLSQLVFAILTAPFPWVLAIAIFWTFTAYPGGNLYIAYGLGYLCGLFAAIGIGMLATTMPRSGGDYVLNGRTLHPLIGLISSFWFTVNVLVSIAFITETLIVGALAPSLVAIGAIGHHQTLLNWGTTL